MTDIHRADCTCDRCINELADAILGKPPTLAATLRAKPLIIHQGIHAERLDFSEEPTIIEETPEGLREKLDAVNARLAQLEKEDINEAAVIARKRAAGTLSDPETCEHLFSWRAGLAPCRLCGAPPRTPDDEWEPEHWAIVRDGKVVSSGSRPAPDYEAMGYPETGVGVDDLESKANVALAGVRAAVSCIEANVILYAWQPPEENNEAR